MTSMDFLISIDFGTDHNWSHYFFFFLDFGPGQLTSFMFILSYEAGFFISKPSSKSTLPWAGLQHMQQCQVGWNIPLSLTASCYWSKWMVHERWSSQWVKDSNPQPSSHESSALTTRPRLLAITDHINQMISITSIHFLWLVRASVWSH